MTAASRQFDQSPQRVLLVLPTWVGDVVMATPFIRSLFEGFPEAEISLLMNRHLYSLLEGSPWVNDCYFWAPRNKTPEAKAEHKALVKTLRDKRFDLVVRRCGRRKLAPEVRRQRHRSGQCDQRPY